MTRAAVLIPGSTGMRAVPALLIGLLLGAAAAHAPEAATPAPQGTEGHSSKDSTIHVDGSVARDQLTAGEARSIAMRALGVMLVEPMTTLPNGDERWSEDPRTFVAVETRQP